MAARSDPLSLTFAALSDPTRRAILARLSRGEASVTQLVEPFEMSQPAISKHLKVLERAGLVVRGRDAQFRPCRIEAAPLKDVSDWVEHYRAIWEARLDWLGDYLQDLQKRRSAMNARNPADAEADTSSGELTLNRTYDAPRSLVFAAWSSAEQIARWWGPNGFTAPVCEVDFRPGGKLVILMRGHGMEHWMRGSFDEIVDQERIVFTVDAGDEGGHLIHTVVTFAGQGGKTVLTIEQTIPKNPMMAKGQRQGWTEQLARLDGLLARP
jgi:uncharacterized protein YndB with AHSA1/START domain/DNA-binding transcriptional ArsR family regulator